MGGLPSSDQLPWRLQLFTGAGVYGVSSKTRRPKLQGLRTDEPAGVSVAGGTSFGNKGPRKGPFSVVGPDRKRDVTTPFTNSAPQTGIIALVNSTDTPGGSGIPAGWYDDPSGEGLRWWDGERWTEHVHTAESAAAATGGESGAGSGSGTGAREGKPPRDLVKLRESIRGRGTKAVGIVLGVIVLAIVVVALLVSGGNDNKSGGVEPGGIQLESGANPAAAKAQRQLKRIQRQLSKKNVTKAQKKKLQRQLKRLQKSASKAAQNQIKAAEKAAKEALQKAGE